MQVAVSWLMAESTIMQSRSGVDLSGPRTEFPAPLYDCPHLRHGLPFSHNFSAKILTQSRRNGAAQDLFSSYYLKHSFLSRCDSHISIASRNGTGIDSCDTYRYSGQGESDTLGDKRWE